MVGGLLIVVRHGICSSIMVSEGEDAEFATVKTEFGNVYFSLLVVYGPQEGDHIDKINHFYKNLSLQIERVSLRGDPILMVGDFNAKLGKTIIKGDIHNMSNNGQKLHNMIIKYNLHLINSMEICAGIFTRINNKIIGEKSMLDYVIASDDLMRYIKNMQIYTNKQFMPWHTMKNGKRFSDHNAVILKLECNKIPSQSENKRETVWDFNHIKGWERFQKITSTDRSTLSDCWNDFDCVKTSCEKWSDKLNSILHDCFPKRRIKKSKQIYDNKIRQLISKRKNLKKQAQSNKTDLTFQHRIDKRLTKR